MKCENGVPKNEKIKTWNNDQRLSSCLKMYLKKLTEVSCK